MNFFFHLKNEIGNGFVEYAHGRQLVYMENAAPNQRIFKSSLSSTKSLLK
jgi:hypothetical protein